MGIRLKHADHRTRGTNDASPGLEPRKRWQLAAMYKWERRSIEGSLPLRATATRGGKPLRVHLMGRRAQTRTSPKLQAGPGPSRGSEPDTDRHAPMRAMIAVA